MVTFPPVRMTEITPSPPEKYTGGLVALPFSSITHDAELVMSPP
jgi:hypothetical protein